MPKLDINAVYKAQGMSPFERKKTASTATSAILTGNFVMMDQQPGIPVQEIELSKIRLRDVNRFHEVENIELDESIRLYGLINPIAVCHHAGEEIYTISAGERRYKAITRLNQRYPTNPRFQKIECKVYILTDDRTLLEQGFPYITEEQEEGIYRDSNIQARQLTDEDIAGQIRRIVDRFEDQEYVRYLRDTAKSAGIATYSSPDRAKLIASVLASQNIWSREKIRQYLKVYDELPDSEPYLIAIERGEMSVNSAYLEVIDKNKLKRNRPTRKLPTLLKAARDFEEEAKNKTYSNKELKDLQDCIETLQNILSDYR